MSVERLRHSRILITGGAGFLGVHVAQELAACGAQLLLQDNAYKRADLLAPVLRSGRMAFVVCDLATLEKAPALLRELPSVDYVVHLGLKVPGPERTLGPDYTEQWLAANLGPFEGLLERLPAGLKGVCLASTLAVYAADGPQPVGESGPLGPSSAQACMKLALEASLARFAEDRGVPATVLRFSTLYGPGETDAPRLIPGFIRSLLAGQPPVVHGDGDSWLDYLYVRDAARAVRLALGYMAEAPGTYNIGAGYGWTAHAVAHALQRSMGLALPPKHMPAAAAPRTLIADTTRARRALHFSPETALADGLAAEVAYVRSQALRAEVARAAAPRPDAKTTSRRPPL